MLVSEWVEERRSLSGGAKEKGSLAPGGGAGAAGTASSAGVRGASDDARDVADVREPWPRERRGLATADGAECLCGCWRWSGGGFFALEAKAMTEAKVNFEAGLGSDGTADSEVGMEEERARWCRSWDQQRPCWWMEECDPIERASAAITLVVPPTLPLTPTPRAALHPAITRHADARSPMPIHVRDTRSLPAPN